MMPRFCLCAVALLFATYVGRAQETDKPRLPKTDWEALGHGVWLASASAKGDDVKIRVSVPMWAPGSTPAQPKGGAEVKGKDVPPAAPAFVASELKAVLKASEVKVYRKDGSLVEAKDLPRLLTKETHVLWGRQKIDPYFLEIARDDVLIIVVDLPTVFKARIPETGKDVPPPPKK